MRGPTDSARAGFTLIEVMIALMVASVVLLAARQLLMTVVDDVGRLPRAELMASRARNSERVLRELMLRIEIDNDGSETFIGAPDSARFASRCFSGGGWLERCMVVLRIRPHADSVSLDLTVDGWVDTLLTRRGVGRIEYLRAAGGAGLWNTRWGAAHESPLAVRITAGDTVLLLRVGARG